MHKTVEFDASLATIDHYTKYPTLMPWIGSSYSKEMPRILVIGESHYLDKGVDYHHDEIAWYAGITIPATDARWVNTREIISNGIGSTWRERSKLIYKNIDSALASCVGAAAPTFSQIAFMNYFQRPAQSTGESLVVGPLDRSISAATLTAVASVITPDLIIFCSGLAWRTAKLDGTLDVLSSRTLVRRAVHPSSRWWHVKMKKYDGRSGREMFLGAIAAAGLESQP